MQGMHTVVEDAHGMVEYMLREMLLDIGESLGNDFGLGKWQIGCAEAGRIPRAHGFQQFRLRVRNCFPAVCLDGIHDLIWRFAWRIPGCDVRY